MQRLNEFVDSYQAALVELGKAVFFGAIWCIAASYTLQTTQALFLHESTGNITVRMDTFLQLYNTLAGKFSGSMLLAVILSWVLLSAYALASAAKHYIKHSVVEESLSIFCHVLIAVDGFANWQYTSGHEWYYQVAITLIIVLVLMNFGRISLHHISKCLKAV